MRTALRVLFATAAVAVVALGGASAALASSDTLPAFTERYNFDDEWCFDYGDYTDCTVSTADMVITYTPAVRSMARIHVRSVTTTFDDATGLQIGTSRTAILDKSTYVDGFQAATFEVSHTRYDGPLGTCTATYQLKIVDYELVVDRFLGPGCA